MWYRVQYGLFQVMTELHHLFGVAAGTKPAALELLIIAFNKLGEMPIQQLPQ